MASPGSGLSSSKTPWHALIKSFPVRAAAGVLNVKAVNAAVMATSPPDVLLAAIRAFPLCPFATHSPTALVGDGCDAYKACHKRQAPLRAGPSLSVSCSSGPLRVPDDGAERRGPRDPPEGDSGHPDDAARSRDVDDRASG